MSQHRPDALRKGIRSLTSMVPEIACELLWPTRCAVCDMYGDKPLCDSCESSLLLIDDLMACPRCGAPYGRVLCTECNEMTLKSAGLSDLPFERMRHSVILDEAAKRIVSLYKDQDERRLSQDMARIMARGIGPEELEGAFHITFVPDTRQAVRRRGFDHSEELASHIASLCRLPCTPVLDRPKSVDQRALGRADRIENMRKSMRVRPDAHVPANLLLVDDVCTTGATIYSACAALSDAGASRIRVITFGVVME